jgi:hypothetical protein
MSLPDELNPRNILSVHEFKQEFQQQSNILSPQIKNTKTTRFFGFAHIFPLNKAFVFLLNIFSFLEKIPG